MSPLGEVDQDSLITTEAEICTIEKGRGVRTENNVSWLIQLGEPESIPRFCIGVLLPRIKAKELLDCM